MRFHALAASVFLVLLSGVALPARAQASQGAADVAPRDIRDLREVQDTERAVLAKRAWLDEAKRCPAQLMPKKDVEGNYPAERCAPGKFASCLAQCSGGQASACYWLGFGLQQAKANDDAYEALFQRACKLGAVSGCTNRAAGLSKAAPTQESAQACAMETFTKACALDEPWGCTMQALHLSQGTGARQDLPKALDVLKKSCAHGANTEPCRYGMRLKKSIESRMATPASPASAAASNGGP